MTNLNRLMAKGALWTGFLRICVRMIGLASTVILARLLVPADFGLVAMATSVIAFLELATAFSFDIPLIQKQEANREYFDSAWTLNICFYGSLTALVLLLAEPAAAFYGEPRLTTVIYVLAIGFLLQGFENIGVVYFRKALNFRKDFTLLVSRKIVGFAVTIPLAFLLRSYWALVAGIVASNVAGLLVSYALHPFRPRLSFHNARELINFSKWLILNNAFNFVRNRSPDFVVGRISGAGALGLFTVAYEIATLPTSEIVAPINRAVFPGYSRIATQIHELRKSYLEVLGMIAVVALPAGLGLAAVSEPLVQFMLGDKWLDAAPLVSILAIFAAINTLQANSGSVLNAIGKPQLVSVIGILTSVVLLPSSIWLATREGPLGVAVAFLGTTIIVLPINFYIIGREIGTSYRDIVGSIWAPGLASILMVIGVYTAQLRLIEHGVTSASVSLLLLVCLGIGLYTCFAVIIWLARGQPETPDYRTARLIVIKLREKLER